MHFAAFLGTPMIPVPISIMAPAPTVSITFKEELQVLLLLIESKQLDKLR